MDVLNESADIFANSSTETVAENIDYSLFLNQNNYDEKNYQYDENFQLLLQPQQNELIRINRPFCTSSPLAESSTAFKSNMSGTSTNVSFITNQFISEACNVPVTLYCPFCPDEFRLEFLLKEHIKMTHPNELKNVIRRSDDECVEFNPCPFCHATFYVKELLSKHVVRKHNECVMSMFTDVNPDRYAHCPFCNHKVLVRHSKLLINHIEKKHLDAFQVAINMKCSNVLLNSNDLSFFDYRARRNTSECSSLIKRMTGLSTSGSNIENPRQIKSILKKTTSYPDGLNMDDTNTDGVDDKELSTFSLNNASFIERRSARRRLRFELPRNSPNSDDENDKENYIFHPNKKQNFTSGKDKSKSRWRNLFRLKKKDNNKNKKSSVKMTACSPEKSKSSPQVTRNRRKKEIHTTPVYSNIGFKGEGVSQLAITQFKCGICFEGFTKNALLLDHLRRNHKGLKLMPQYRCGECDAKFFRNSFLVRHCWFHHTPKCLKNGSNEALK